MTGLLPGTAPAQDEAIVDVELVLAVDASWSMDYEEQLIQRDGYASAFRSDEVIEAILYGGYGRVAVTYLEWAGDGSQEIIVPWTLIDSEAAAIAFADSLQEGMPRHFRRTSISGAITFAASLFDQNKFNGLRRIIDISGDGPNNQGGPVALARDAAVSRGVTINGLPLMTNAPGQGIGYAIPNLDRYFAECVIGGGQAFVIPVLSWEEFPVAVRRKLVLELAGRMPDDDDRAEVRGDVPFTLAQYDDGGDLDMSGADCLIGEKIWERRRNMWTTP